ncbi:MAG TPA: selenocysteine-specific translation elongation factor [Mycobacterium sp.]|nr:selenocysteine-specific translation elongation factor [Mycobacterium sp.]
MFVVATAGHVDHGKSTLVRALTGMEPDRWEEERRRGLTIDLGFAWTTLPSGREVAFVDVPGHVRFLGNTLAGLGPAPVVCFVVAVDQGWQAQSGDHRDAVAALGIRHGLVVLTRADLAPDRAGDVLTQVRAELAGTGLRDAPAVTVSAADGTGLAELREILDRVLARVPAPATAGRLRLWVDRSFTVTGAGTVVTGTLTAGTLACGDRLQLLGSAGRGNSRPVTVRGLQCCDKPRPSVAPVSRVALNLRGVAAHEVRRGDALVTPGAWPETRILDVRRGTGVPFSEAPQRLTVHVGTAAVPARLRPFDDHHARLTLDRALPLVLGDRLVLRHPGSRRILGGAQVLDADPPPLRRRGDGARRAEVLTGLASDGDVLAEVARRGAVTEQHLHRLGYDCRHVPAGVRVLSGWWVHAPAYEAWKHRLRVALQTEQRRDPLTDGLSRGAAADLIGLPDEALLDPLAGDAGLELRAGRIRLPGSGADLGPAEPAVAELELRLTANPFHAPEADDLAALHLGVRELAAAERAGRLLRLTDAVVLLPSAPALAMRELAGLEQPFTTSQARQALGTTRRVAIPLLEHLDARGWTRRTDAGHRKVVR